MKRLLAVVILVVVTSPGFAGDKLKLHKMNAVPDEYLVILADQVPSDKVDKSVRSIAKKYGVQVLTVWSNAINGFHGKATAESIRQLADDPAVAFVEQNFTRRQNFREHSGRSLMESTSGTWTESTSPPGRALAA
jgi:hypothetical protein